jgi:hypothetical protein
MHVGACRSSQAKGRAQAAAALHGACLNSAFAASLNRQHTVLPPDPALHSATLPQTLQTTEAHHQAHLVAGFVVNCRACWPARLHSYTVTADTLLQRLLVSAVASRSAVLQLPAAAACTTGCCPANTKPSVLCPSPTTTSCAVLQAAYRCSCTAAATPHCLPTCFVPLSHHNFINHA